MTTTPGSPTRAFNALNGAEVRTRILQEVERRLAEDTRLGAHLVFPVVTWTWTLELETFPSPGIVGPGADGVLRTTIRGRVAIEGDGSQLETGPAVVTSRPSVLADPRGGTLEEAAQRQTGFGATRPFLAPGASPSVTAALEARLGRLEQLITEALAPPQPMVTGVTVLGGALPPPPVTGVMNPVLPVPMPPVAFHPDVQTTTGTGLPITGGARPSPGPGLAETFGGGSAVGTVQAEPTPTATPMVYGVQHPPLDEGGVGAPDAVRREAGLPVPQMQSTAGGIVDLPAGSF